MGYSATSIETRAGNPKQWLSTDSFWGLHNPGLSNLGLLADFDGRALVPLPLLFATALLLESPLILPLAAPSTAFLFARCLPASFLFLVPAARGMSFKARFLALRFSLADQLFRSSPPRAILCVPPFLERLYEELPASLFRDNDWWIAQSESGPDPYLPVWGQGANPVILFCREASTLKLLLIFGDLCTGPEHSNSPFWFTRRREHSGELERETALLRRSGERVPVSHSMNQSLFALRVRRPQIVLCCHRI